LDISNIKNGVVMRLDKFLKLSRLIKRRTLAAQACAAGRVIVNGKTAKASYEVKIGDIIEVHFYSGITKAEVVSLKEIVKKDETDLMIKLCDV